MPKRGTAACSLAQRLPSLSRPYVSVVHGSACGGAVHRGAGAGGAVMVQGDDEHLGGLLHQGFPVIGEEQVVVGDPVAHRVIGTHGVEEGGKEGQGVSVVGEEGQGCRDTLGPVPSPRHAEGSAKPQVFMPIQKVLPCQP